MASARHSYTASPTTDRPLKRPLSSVGADLPTPASKVLKPSLPTPDPSPKTAASTEDSIFRSAPLHDRQSTFEGLFSPSLAPLDLQSHASIASASHKILAWRLPSAQRTLGPSQLYTTGKDDDGEQYGARTALKVLEEEDVAGAVVIARWYGGVMLGPVRFAHMQDVAREAIRKWKEGQGERVKIAELITELEARDASIVSMRALLEQKKEQLAKYKGESSGGGLPQGAGSKVTYEGKTLAQLKVLDKSRDNTVMFLLKALDAADEALNKAKEEKGVISGEGEQDSLDEPSN